MNTWLPVVLILLLAWPAQVRAADMLDIRALGAVGDGVADDRAAVQRALDTASGRCVLVPAGHYRIGAGVTLPPGACLRGEGPGRSVLLAGATLRTGLVIGMHAAGYSVSDLGLSLDGQATEGAVPLLDATFAPGFRVARVAFQGIDRYGMIVNNSSGGLIEDSSFDKPVRVPTTNAAILVTGWVDGVRILRNTLRGSGIDIHATNGVIVGNDVSGAWGAAIFAEQFLDRQPSARLLVADNRVHDNRGVNADGVPAIGLEIWAACARITGNAVQDNDGAGLAIGGTGAWVADNRFLDNGGSAGGGVPGPAILAIFNAPPNTAEGSVFTGNVARNTHGATQTHGLYTIGSGLAGTRYWLDRSNDLAGNAVLDFGGGAHGFTGPAPGRPCGADVPGP